MEIGRDLEQVVKLGRGNFSPSSSTMDQVNLLVANTGRGWAVSFRGLPLATAKTMTDAIEAASAHALDRFTVTGQPIGIIARWDCGCEVLVDMHS